MAQARPFQLRSPAELLGLAQVKVAKEGSACRGEAHNVLLQGGGVKVVFHLGLLLLLLLLLRGRLGSLPAATEAILSAASPSPLRAP